MYNTQNYSLMLQFRAASQRRCRVDR